MSVVRLRKLLLFTMSLGSAQAAFSENLHLEVVASVTNATRMREQFASIQTSTAQYERSASTVQNGLSVSITPHRFAPDTILIDFSVAKREAGHSIPLSSGNLKVKIQQRTELIVPDQAGNLISLMIHAKNPAKDGVSQQENPLLKPQHIRRKQGVPATLIL